MLSEELKSLISNTGGRYIIVENNKPKYVAMGFEEYRNVILDRKVIKSLTEEELIDKINDDIALWRESQDGKKEAEKEMLVGDIEKLEDIEYVQSSYGDLSK